MIGVDLSQRMLDQARERARDAGHRNVELVQSDLREYVEPERTAAVISAFGMERVPDPDDVIRRLARELRRRVHHTSVHRFGIGIGQSVTDRSWVFATADGQVIEPPRLGGSAGTLEPGLGLGLWEGDPARMSHIIDALVLAMADHGPADAPDVSAETSDGLVDDLSR